MASAGHRRWCRDWTSVVAASFSSYWDYEMYDKSKPRGLVCVFFSFFFSLPLLNPICLFIGAAKARQAAPSPADCFGEGNHPASSSTQDEHPTVTIAGRLLRTKSHNLYCILPHTTTYPFYQTLTWIRFPYQLVSSLWQAQLQAHWPEFRSSEICLEPRTSFCGS